MKDIVRIFNKCDLQIGKIDFKSNNGDWDLYYNGYDCITKRGDRYSISIDELILNDISLKHLELTLIKHFKEDK